MPQAVFHILTTIIILDIFRDYVLKEKRRFPLSLVLIGGIAGLLPDIDIPLHWVGHNLLGFQMAPFHRTFTHNIFFPLMFFVLGGVYYMLNQKKPAVVFWVISFGITWHIILDMVLSGGIMPFFPFSSRMVEFGLLSHVKWQSLYEGIDAILLTGWLIHEEMRHKISDFI